MKAEEPPVQFFSSELSWLFTTRKRFSVDEDIQELLLSLHDDGLLEPPPASKANTQRSLWRCIGSVALLSIAIFFLFFIPKSFFHAPKQTPSSPSLPKYEYERALWTANDLLPDGTVEESLLTHLEILKNEQERRGAFRSVHNEIAAILEGSVLHPEDFERLQTLVQRIHTADMAYTESLNQIVSSFPEGKDTLHVCSLTQRLNQYEHVKRALSEKKEMLEASLLNAQAATSIKQLNEVVSTTSSLLEQFQKESLVAFSLDLESYKQRLQDISLQTIDTLVSKCAGGKVAQEEREALWQIQALLPNHQIERLPSYAERFFIAKTELPKSEDIALSTKRHIETQVTPYITATA